MVKKVNKKTKFISSLAFYILINFTINALLFHSFIRDYSIYPSKTNNIPFLNLIIYFLEYIFIPLLYFLFYYFNKFKINYKMIFFILCPFLFYLIIKFFLNNLELNFSKINFFLKEQFIRPYDKKHYLICYLKIIISFFILSISFWIFFQNQKYFLSKNILILFVLFLISVISYNKSDWLHAKKVIKKAKMMGSGMFPETQEISEYFKNISDLKPKDLKSQNGKILELGAGCGNITQYLIEKFEEENIICLEIDHDLCQELKTRFPSITVIEGDASEFETLISKNKIQNEQIKGIVSSLPIALFEEEKFKKFESSITKIINDNKIKFMNYRFNFFEKDTREMKRINKIKNNTFNFISEMIIPVNIYTYESKN
ncbi:rRNA adenine N-6-methyltransferase family protein [Candidatus Phytoplasma pini]|nr:rRNA adenine N-6-methyltransferase family protein [Candidatus Phytoplasma pini]